MGHKKKHAPILLGNRGSGWTAPHAKTVKAWSAENAGKPPAASPAGDDKATEGMSNIQKLYLTGGVLDTASIVMGTWSAASAIRGRGQFEEAVFIENARRLRIAAKDSRDRGETEVANYLEGIRKLEGAQTAALAAQGIDVGRGSAKAIREETIETGFEDAATLRTNAIREAFGFEKQALEQEKGAKMTRIGRKSKEKTQRLLGYQGLAQAAVNTSIKMNKAGSA